MNVRQLGRIGAALAATAVTVAVLAACGSSSTTKQTATANSAAGGQQGIQAYVSCLNKHGVTISVPSRFPGTRPSDRPSGGVRPSRSPGAGGGFGGGGFGGGGGFPGGAGAGIFGDPSTPPSGVPQSTWTAAVAACKSVQPTFGGRGAFGGGSGGGGTEFQAYRNCLTSHGVSASTGPGAFNTTDPTVAAALKACKALLPTRPTASPTS